MITKVTPVKRTTTAPVPQTDPVPDKMDSATWTQQYVRDNEDECSEGLLCTLDAAKILLQNGDYEYSAKMFSAVVHGLEMLSKLGPKAAEVYKPPLYANYYALSRICAFRLDDRSLAKDAANKAYACAKECASMQHATGKGSADNDMEIIRRYKSVLSLGRPAWELENQFGEDFPYDICDLSRPEGVRRPIENRSKPSSTKTSHEPPQRKEPMQTSAPVSAKAPEKRYPIPEKRKSPLGWILACFLVLLLIVGMWYALRTLVFKKYDLPSWLAEVIAHEDAEVFAPSDGEPPYESDFVAMFEPGIVCNTISVGGLHAIALHSDGTVQVAAVDETAQKQFNVSGWKDITAVEAGGCHIVGLRSDGTVVATGNNSSLECSVNTWSDILAISAGESYTVGLRSDGTVVATGNNSFGQCNVSDWTGIVAVDAGAEHTVGLRVDGTVIATGHNDKGQCNTEDWTDIAAVCAGYQHTVAVKHDGTVVAVGSNEHGQCNVSSWADIIAVACDGCNTIGLRSDGTLAYDGWWNTVTGPSIYGVLEWRDIVAISNFDSSFFGLHADGSVETYGTGIQGLTDIMMPSKVEFAIPPVIEDSSEISFISLDKNTDIGKYSGLLEQYCTAISRRDNMDDLRNANLNYLIAYNYDDTPMDNTGYCLLDLDEDGSCELLITPIFEGKDYGGEEKRIYDLYTLENDIPVLLYSSGERNRMLCLRDKSLYMEGSSGADSSGFFKGVLSGGQLNKALSLDYYNGAWLMTTPNGSEYVSAEYAQGVKSELESMAILLDYTPLSAYPGLK